MDRLSLGIDIGSSGCKAVALDQNRDVRGMASVRYENTIIQIAPGHYEQSMDVLKEAAFQCLRKIVSNLKKEEYIGCVSLTGQMHGMAAIDEAGKPIRPMISCVDSRNEIQTRKLYDKIGGIEGILALTNNRMLSSCTGGKILWMMEREPENFKKTWCVLNPKDYVRFCLTGIQATDVSDASGYGLYDTKNRKWSQTLLQRSGIPENILPEVYDSVEKAGRISAQASQQTGIPEGTLVIAGGGDAVVQTVGTGGGIDGIYSIILGTGGLISASLKKFRINKEARLQIYSSVIRGQWVAYAGLLSVGAAIEWFKKCWFKNEEKECDGDIYRIMEKEALEVPAGSRGLIFYPTLMGQRNPVENPSARGVLTGLSPVHERGHMYRAMLEGLAMGMKQAAESLTEICGDIKKIHISGGGAVSDLWCQIFADVFQKEIIRVRECAFCGAVASAVLGLSAMGVYKTEKEAFQKVSVEKSFFPNQKNKSLYENMYRSYEKIYPAMEDVFADIKTYEEATEYEENNECTGKFCR